MSSLHYTCCLSNQLKMMITFMAGHNKKKLLILMKNSNTAKFQYKMVNKQEREIGVRMPYGKMDVWKCFSHLHDG